ncbi:MAG TPA: type II toxin-antitoxin system antitoxin SocA domain-containing protein [Actinomycetota bacterium]|nr:type II toxin-antitoxin system antitoxin SocA domain-containing protein [Actinomycetota bacterium]
MIRARDVAAAIIEMDPGVDQMKLQKLLYYAQGWHLAWYGEPLFADVVEAWAFGPAVGDVYTAYKDCRDEPIATPSGGDPEKLGARERRALEAVVAAYAPLTGPQLAALTHREGPWVAAREGYEHGQRSRRAMSRDLIRRYFEERSDFGATRPEVAEPSRPAIEEVANGAPGGVAAVFEEGLGVSVSSSTTL